MLWRIVENRAASIRTNLIDQSVRAGACIQIVRRVNSEAQYVLLGCLEEQRRLPIGRKLIDLTDSPGTHKHISLAIPGQGQRVFALRFVGKLYLARCGYPVRPSIRAGGGPKKAIRRENQ